MEARLGSQPGSSRGTAAGAPRTEMGRLPGDDMLHPACRRDVRVLLVARNCTTKARLLGNVGSACVISFVLLSGCVRLQFCLASC